MTYTEKQSMKTTALLIAALLAVVAFVAAATMLPVAVQERSRQAAAARIAAAREQAEIEAEQTTAATMRAVRQYLDHDHHRAGVCPDWHLNKAAVASILGDSSSR